MENQHAKLSDFPQTTQQVISIMGTN